MGKIVRPTKRILASQKKETSALEKCVLTSGNEDILALPEGNIRDLPPRPGLHPGPVHPLRPAPPAGPSTVCTISLAS